MAKYCEEIVRQIEGLLVLGLSNERVCEAVGLGKSTFYDWEKKTPHDIWRCNCKIVFEDKDGRPFKVAKTWEGKFPERHFCVECKSELRKKLDFSERIKKAKATGQAQLLAIIKKAAPVTWQAAAWMLERIWWNEFGKKERGNGEPDANKDIEPYEEFRKKHGG